ncbi:MAG TPA: hypothetical protein VF691_13145 [Cytophagaceae bacterium]|jgi:hypothetical protein
MKSQNFLIFLLPFLVSCSAWKDPSKYRLSDGNYKLRQSQSVREAYIKLNEDEVKIHYLSTDSTASKIITILATETEEESLENFKAVCFKRTFDIDFVTVPFKLRPTKNDFPAQLSTNINGSFFIGFRYDQYKIKYKNTLLNTHKREINHFGYSLGLFNGFGATAMNPWVTNNKINIEYDGVVYLKGVALLLGIDNLNFGIALGMDHLLDSNKSYWIYQGTPWVGITLGLNLN